MTLLHANRDRELTDVTVSSAPADNARRSTGEGEGERSTRGPTSSVLETTAHHPFRDVTTGTWVDAADLKPGKSTLVGPDGQIEYVTAVRNFTGAEVMRDLTVATAHTYFVLAGATPVLVHNIDVGELNSCPVSPTTHWVDVTVTDSQGSIIHDYSLRSGAQRPSEAAIGRDGETLSHTENRVARMSGGVPSYGRRTVRDDEFFMEKPAPLEGHVVIQGTRPPCSSCRGSMNRAAEDTGATFTYFWEHAGEVRVWQSTR